MAVLRPRLNAGPVCDA